jgi:cobaltochelatase CobT subunit
MLTASPTFVGLWHRFARRSNPKGESGYTVFTTAFDETVNGRDLTRILPKLTPSEAQTFEATVRRYEIEFSEERIVFGAAAAKLVRDLQASFSREERSQSVVSFLIDHSGSMRGLRMLSALLAVDAAVDALANAGVATEILGFTTATWQGGRARRAWKWAGKPRNPGRLCDLRHIVYGATDRPSRVPEYLRLALRPDVLRENIDGEALKWAASRLDRKRWAHRVICMISDGAPVDDSTLLANEDQELLTRHLERTEQALRADGVTVGFLLIGGDHIREPDLHEQAAEPEAAGLSLLELVRRAFIRA